MPTKAAIPLPKGGKVGKMNDEPRPAPEAEAVPNREDLPSEEEEAAEELEETLLVAEGVAVGTAETFG